MHKLIVSCLLLAFTSYTFAQPAFTAISEVTGFLNIPLQGASTILIFQDGFETIPKALCDVCESDDDCFGPTDKCLLLDGIKVCTKDCSEGNPHGTPAGECPLDYACMSDAQGGFQCVPASGSCTCFAENDGATRICSNSNNIGTCEGFQICNAAQGWSICNANTPAPEICDGVDNDCNGEIDDSLDPLFCPLQKGVCLDSVATCRGELGYFECGADEYGPEYEAVEISCDGKDNDCDGTVDEGCGS